MNKISMDILHEIEWLSFEKLCAEYIRMENFIPKTTALGKDGGVDIYIHEKESLELLGIVQCKAWKTIGVGITVIRELNGVMSSEKVEKGFVMTSGHFTQEAKNYAQKNNIYLIAGETLVKEINNLPEEKLKELINEVLSGDYKTPTCPRCGIKMKLRKGTNFWGCVNYFSPIKCNRKIYTKKEINK